MINGRNFNGEDPILSFQIFKDIRMKALFKKIISEKNSPKEAVTNAFEAVNKIDSLSPELKQKAIVELL